MNGSFTLPGAHAIEDREPDAYQYEPKSTPVGFAHHYMPAIPGMYVAAKPMPGGLCIAIV